MRKGLKIIPVSEVGEVLKIALNGEVKPLTQLCRCDACLKRSRPRSTDKKALFDIWSAYFFCVGKGSTGCYRQPFSLPFALILKASVFMLFSTPEMRDDGDWTSTRWGSVSFSNRVRAASASCS